MREYIDLFSALLTPIIAIVTVSILVLQYLLARQRWKLDLYDKRYPVYLTTMRFLSKIIREGTTSTSEVFQFGRDSKERELLFGNEVQEFLNGIEKEAMKLSALRTKLTPLPVGRERSELIDKELKLIEWFEVQFKRSKGIFSVYLLIDKK